MRRGSVASVSVMVSIVLASAALTAMASPVLGTSREWTIEPPAGWQEDAEAAKQAERKFRAKVPKLGKVEFRFWGPPEPGASMAVQWYLVSFDGKASDAIDTLDRGVVKQMTPSAAENDGSSRTVGSMVIRDARGDSFNGTKINVRAVRRYQPAVDGLHALVAFCVSLSGSPPCDAALDSIQFSVRDAVPLDGTVDAVAYQFGRVLGFLLIIGVPLGVLLAIGNRRSRRAVRAAARPGSPPGPGGAADGR